MDGKKMRSNVQTITPELAKIYLNKSRGNREISDARVAQYASDMKLGRWQVTHQGVGFDVNGVLKDGHHRLNAIIKANVPIDMLVTENIPCESTLFDRGYGRNTRQFLMYNEGLPSYLTDNTAIAIANMHIFMEGSTPYRNRSDFDIKNFLLRHKDTMLSTMQIFSSNKEKGRGGFKNASIGYAMFCALKCGVSQDELKRFLHIVTTGFSDGPEDYAAVVIRNQFSSGEKTHGMWNKQEMCKNCQAAIRDFVCGRSRKKAYSEKEAYYTKLWTSERAI